MFKPTNIFIWFLIAVFGYIFINYSWGAGKLLTADVFRTDAKIAWDIYYTDKDWSFDIYSNFDSEPWDLWFVLSWDDTKVKVDTSQIKSDYNSNINNISENMLQIDIKKTEAFWPKAKLLTIKYTWEPQNINISDAKMTYASWSDLLAITRLSQ